MKKLIFTLSFILAVIGMKAETYTLVTSASELSAGDKIIVTSVNGSTNYALSTTQNSNNRSGVEITITDNAITDPETNVQIIELVASSTDGKYNLKVGDDSYLYASSNSSNQLKSATLQTNGSSDAAISYTDGEAQILFSRSGGSRNDLRFNYNNGTTIFACYATGKQTAISIYKLKEEVVDPSKVATSVSISGENAVEVGSTVALTAEVTCEEGAVAGATVSFTSSNEEVATVDENGVVTGVKKGTATITATYAGEGDYLGSSATYTITVNAAPGVVTAGDCTFGEDWNTAFGTSYTGSFPTTASSLKLEATQNGVTLTVTNGESTSGYVKTSDFRAYKNYTMTFTAPTGYNITKIVTKKGGKTFSSGIGATSGELSIADNAATWTGKESSVVWNITGTVSFATITVTIEKTSSIATPTFSVEAGDVVAGTEVEISCETMGALIYYTTDGTAPTNESTAYNAPLTIDATTTLKAVAYVGEESSNVATATYTVIPAVTSLAVAKGFTQSTDYIVNVPLTVVYSGYSNTYVYDGTNCALIYKSGLSYDGNAVLKAGWKAQTTTYQNLVEIDPQTTPEVDSEASPNVPDPRPVSAAEIGELLNAANQDMYVKLSGVSFTNAIDTGAFTGTYGETEITFYNRFKLEADIANMTGDVEGFIGVNNSTVQIYPTKISGLTAIQNISAEEGAVRYFNLQGVEVANPVRGNVYIRVAGENATKVLVK